MFKTWMTGCARDGFSRGNRLWHGVFLWLMLLAIPIGMQAQSITGTITGTITDSSGAAIAGATVTAINSGTNETYRATTTSSGGYTLPTIPAGTYTVRVEQQNFKSFVSTNVVVHTSSTTDISATLEVGAKSEQVTVTADQVAVDTTTAVVGEVVQGTQVRELPLNGENFVGLTQLSPGVSAAASYDGTGKGLSGGVNFSVNGNPYTNNLFLIDGVNNNDVGSGRTILVYPSIDTIAEFKMIRNSYGPEYGQASGAIISITTKSGQNQFHGGFFYAGRNDLLDANDWVSNNQNTGKAKLRHNDWGYNISGPAIKDRLFLWWNQEWDREIRGHSFGACVPTTKETQGDFSEFPQYNEELPSNDPNQVKDQCNAIVPDIPAAYRGSDPRVVANPDAAGLLIAQYYPAPNVNPQDGRQKNNAGNNYAESINNLGKWSEWNVRGDYDITKSNRVTFRWTQDSWDNPAPNYGDAFWGEGDFTTVDSSWSQPSKSVMAKLSTTLSSTMVNEFSFGYGHNAIITTLAGSKANIVSELQTAYPASFPASIKQKDEFFGAWGGLDAYGQSQGASFWNIAPYKNHEDLYTLQDNLSKIQGNHTLRAGAFFSINAKVEDNGNGEDRPGLPKTVYCPKDGEGTPTTACVDTHNQLANIFIPGAPPAGTLPQEFTVTENSIDATAYVHWHDFEWYLGDTWKVNRKLTLNYGFRWSFYREPYGGDDHWANWSYAKWSAAEATANPSDACNGVIIVPGTTPCADASKFLAGLGVNLPLSNGTPGSNRALVNNNSHTIAPRVGVAWDVFGDSKLAVRAGAGQFYQREIVGIDEGLARTAPFVIGATTNRTLDAAAQLQNPAVSPNAAKDPRGVVPNSWQWNLSIERELAHNTSLQLGYVGNTGVHLTSMYDLNAVPQSSWLDATFQSGSAQNLLRPAFNFGQIGGFARGGHASYHSLQVLFRAQQGPSTFQAAYTWGHSIANVELDNSSGSFNQQAITDQNDPGLDKGNTNINRPNIFVANEVLFLPKFAGHGNLVRQTLGGWEFSSIFSAAQGNSLTVFANGTFNGGAVNGLVGTGYLGNLRPLLSGNCNAGEKANQILNASAFTLVGYALGTFPSNIASRGSCRGAPYTNLDSQLAKNWSIKEKYRVKFSMDFFNLFNHANFISSSLEGTGYAPSNITCGESACSPTNNIITSQSAVTNFGQTSNVHGGRELQYTLRFSF